MAGWIGGAAIAVGVGVAVAGVAMAVSGSHAADVAAEAQKDVAETNARATVEAAKEAADAQKFAAAEDSKARMFESQKAYDQEVIYLQHETKMAEMDSSAENFYKNTRIEVDAIDSYYAETSPMGSSKCENSYDYGFDSGGGGGGGGSHS